MRGWLSLAPGSQGHLVVEAEATLEQARGTFLLKLGKAGRAPSACPA